LQPSIPTEAGFGDYLPLSGSEPIVPAIAARVWPKKLGAYGPAVARPFLLLSGGSPSSVPGFPRETAGN
jgi:hypothetical protein